MSDPRISETVAKRDDRLNRGDKTMIIRYERVMVVVERQSYVNPTVDPLNQHGGYHRGREQAE